MDKDRIIPVLQIGNLLAVLFTIIVNGLANTLPINGKLTGDISDAIPNLFVPSGITFAVWGVIYVLLILFGIYQIKSLFSKEKEDFSYIKKINVFFITASIGNIIWIFLWHYEQIALSILPMILLFLSLLAIYIRLDIGKSDVSLKQKIFVHIPFSVYIGWITVATIANVTGVLVDLGWDGFGISEQIWTLLILIVATLITIIVIVTRKDIAYSLVIIWALLGIYIKRINPDPIYGIQTQIAYMAVISIIVIIIALIAVNLPIYLKKGG